MPMKYRGNRAALADMLDSCDIKGCWDEPVRGQFMFRCIDGANLHFVPANGSLWFSGKNKPRSTLAEQVLAILNDQFREWEAKLAFYREQFDTDFSPEDAEDPSFSPECAQRVPPVGDDEEEDFELGEEEEEDDDDDDVD